MLPDQPKTLELKMTLPTNARSTMQSTEMNNIATVPCTTINLQFHQQHPQQQQQQQMQQFENHPTIKTSSGTSTSMLSPFLANQDLALENVMPGIYLTKNFIAWTEENLRTHGFTHIIIIDKHIQELYYPSPVFKLSSEPSSDFDDRFDVSTVHGGGRSQLSFGKEFAAIDLNFGEKSYLTTVLPNCYRAVKFINKALQAGGTILVIDCNGGEQKCLTIIVAFLMYKNNINFSDAFSRLKGFYKKADLDRFYISQLYEYEPILQVQRAQSRGHSCSRELHSAILKRKKIEDDTPCIGESANEFLNTMNPLTQFHSHQQQQQPHQTQSTTMTTPTYSSGSHAWDDYVMD